MATRTRAAEVVARTIAKSTDEVIHERIAPSIPAAAKQAGLTQAQATSLQSAVVDYYLLIDFAFTSSTFQPNSIQFYSNTSGFLCSKLIDNVSLVSLVPILNCKTVRVTWDTSNLQAVHIYGYQPK